MGGLINSNFLGGAAPGVTQMGAQLTAYGLTKSLQDQQEQARRDMEERIAERNAGVRTAERTQDRAYAVDDQKLKRLETIADQDTAQENALALQDRKEGNVETQSRRASLVSSLTDIQKKQDRLELLQSTAEDETQKTKYSTRIESLNKESDRIRTALNKLGGLPEPEKGAVDPDNPLGLKLPPLEKKTTGEIDDPAAAPQDEYNQIEHLLDPRNVTPYEDKLAALMKLQPNRAAPQAEQNKWRADYVRLQATKKPSTGIINRAIQ